MRPLEPRPCFKKAIEESRSAAKRDAVRKAIGLIIFVGSYGKSIYMSNSNSIYARVRFQPSLQWIECHQYVTALISNRIHAIKTLVDRESLN
jgi:hypothetical protein